MAFFDGNEVLKVKEWLAGIFAQADLELFPERPRLNAWTTNVLDFNPQADWDAILRELVLAEEKATGKVYGIIITRTGRRAQSKGAYKKLFWDFGIYIFASYEGGPPGNNSEDRLDKLIERADEIFDRYELDADEGETPNLLNDEDADEDQDGITGTQGFQVARQDLILYRTHRIQGGITVELDKIVKRPVQP